MKVMELSCYSEVDKLVVLISAFQTSSKMGLGESLIDHLARLPRHMDACMHAKILQVCRR